MTDQVTRAWAELLPYAEPADARGWLGEHGAFVCWELGVRSVNEPAVAEVLALVLGHPSDVMEGEPLA